MWQPVPVSGVAAVPQDRLVNSSLLDEGLNRPLLGSTAPENGGGDAGVNFDPLRNIGNLEEKGGVLREMPLDRIHPSAG